MQNEYRSYEKIRRLDLRRLAKIAQDDLIELFYRKPDLGEIYRNRIICIALCQGAALHYIDGKNGVKDFDVWTFFREHKSRPFPYRRNVARDFGTLRFGLSPDAKDFKGKRVDLIGRAIPYKSNENPIQTVQKYLAKSKNKTPKLLSQKAIVIIEPEEFLGTVAWPIK